ncbi:MAG: DUF2207 domain-containing protein [Firmicutes bacterium]|nr:DUF2207 domain-containing protein [Bacillota bacterium]
MTKFYKNILFSLIILFSFFFCVKDVYASNSINSIDMDVYIDSNGNAAITEVWKANLNQGTEGYRPYSKLGNSTISNFSVSDDTGRIYESLSFWNTSSSFSEKAYKSGIHNIYDGVELCFGISKYGSRTYTLKYNISNFVTQYTDTQGIYFNFVNFDQSIGHVTIKLHSDKPFSLDNSKIWAFGNNGKINFKDGSIFFDSKGFVSSSQYVVELVRFESNLFNTSSKSEQSFDDVYDSAFSDVKDDETKLSIGKLTLPKLVLLIIMIPIGLLLSPVGWVLIIVLILNLKGPKLFSGTSTIRGGLDFGSAGKVLPDYKETNYWREVPLGKDLEKAYWVSSQYNVVSERTLKEGIIGAILLKWIRSGYVTVTKTKKGLFSFKDNNYAIDFTKMTAADNDIENSLFKMLLTAAGSNKLLEAREFSKWSKKNYYKVNNWFSSINYKEEEYLEKEKLLTSTIQETTGFFGQKLNKTIYHVDPLLKEEAIKLVGLKKFLLDFSMMPERQYYEVHVWEDYLIFAQLLGIADKVSEQFSKLYPKFNEETLLNTDVNAMAAREMAHICYSGVQAGIDRANMYSGSSSSSGGGGSSFSSGGSSSGGSSGGGFR